MRRVAYKVDGPHGAVGLDLARHAPYAALLEWVITVAIESHQQQTAVGGRVEAHALVHDVAVVRFGYGYAGRSLIGWEGHNGLGPVAAVGRCY